MSKRGVNGKKNMRVDEGRGGGGATEGLTNNQESGGKKRGLGVRW